MHRYYGKKVIILLDGYDTPMQEAYVDGFWDELVAFTRSMFNSTFKTNPWLERGIMSGITRVSKESIFSDLNNLKVVTTTSDEYATSFGFTEQEVFEALEECGLEEEKENVRQWYDGFIFGRHKDIYNPWSILNFLDTGKFTTYWANTSSNRFVLGLMVDLQDRYIITSNRESGFGRYDVMLDPRETEKNDAILLEFKVHDPEDEENLRDTVQEALRQIEEKQYDTALIARGIPKKRIRKYGFAFEGKKVLIG